ncbi:MAG: LON peptidase substrate-binding domain-containing protein [Alphaproteobacteria bacterium]
MRKTYHHSNELPKALPVFPLLGAILLPRARLPLNVFEPRYLEMVDKALATEDRMIVVVQPNDPAADLGPEHTPPPALYRIGCAGRIVSFMETDDGRSLISLEGVARVRLGDEHTDDIPYRVFDTDFVFYEKDLEADARESEMNRDGLMKAVKAFTDHHNISMDFESMNKTKGEALINSLSIIAPYGAREKQALLEADSVVERTETLIALTEMALAGGDGAPGSGGGSLQ